MMLNNKAAQLDELLNNMAEAIQLDDTRYDRMKVSYQAVQTWLEADDTFFKNIDFEVYPQGSVKTSTANRPIKGDEFDLDIVVQIKHDTGKYTPGAIFGHLKRRLGESEIYSKIIVLKNRCVRLDYSGDFHMDILSGVQEFDRDENKIKIPDRELGDWVSGNPRGFSDWFLDKANTVVTSLLEKAFSAEDLPTDKFKNKKPLQIAVQLIKRARDIYFQDNDEYKTSSIILTTLAGHFYNGEDSIYESITNIFARIEDTLHSSSRLKLLNPVNVNEDFTDKWADDSKYYIEFKAFFKEVRTAWEQLKMNNGVINEGRALSLIFGQSLFDKAQKNIVEETEQFRRKGKLLVDKNSGGLTTAITPASLAIKANTFFGK